MALRTVLLWSLLVLALPCSAWAQSGTIRGIVTDASDGQAMQGVNVLVLDGETLVTGVASNRDGFYTIPSVPVGTYTLRATFIGYRPFEVTVAIDAGEVVTQAVALSPDEALLDEVVVEAQQSGATRVTAGQQTISPADIQALPAPDVTGDLVNYLTTLPGVVSTGDRGGQLFIRGGEPTQNLVLLDGMVVYQPFHVVGFYSAFPSDILNRADIYAGGFGSRYGGRMSSVLDVATRTGNKQEFTGAVAGAPFVSTLRVEGPIVKDRISVLTSVRQSLIELTADPLVGRDLPFNFFDTFGKVHASLNETSQLALTGLFTTDRGTLVQEGGGTPAEEVRWENQAIGGRYVVLPKAYPILAEAMVSYSRLRTELGPSETPNRVSEISNFNVETHATYYGTNADINMGFRMTSVSLQNRLGGAYQVNINEDEFAPEIGFYVEPEFRLGNGLRVRTGVVLQHYKQKPFPVVEPRLRLVWEGRGQQISAAFGRYHQELVGLNDKRDAASVFTAWTLAPADRVPESWQGILGYRFTLLDGLDVSLEGFYKELYNLSIPEWSAFPALTTRIQSADGAAYGADVRLEVNQNKFYGYINYGLSNVTYRSDQENFQLWFDIDELEFRPPHDRRHQLTMVGTYGFGPFDASVRWQFGAGLPFNQALGFDGLVVLDGPVNVNTDPGFRRVIYERPYNGVLPTYHRLDVSVERSFEFEYTTVKAQAGLINAYDRANLFYLDVFTLDRADQLPLVPTFGLEIALK
ncbi:MAG: TonB-dependent receptor [Bacteroidota bacterium]